MKMLSEEALARAAQFLHENGRPLERALYDWQFDGGATGAVIKELGAYQNGDGGFGRALEPDIHAPESSVIATSFAFNVLREIEAGTAEPVVIQGLRFLIRQYDSSLDRWPIVPPEVDQAPRAWWWDYEDSAKNFNNFVFNPRLAVIGHLQHYHGLVPSEWLSRVRRKALADVRASTVEASMFDIHAGYSLLEADELPEPARDELARWLRAAAKSLLPRKADLTREYQLMPLDLAPSPDAPLADAVHVDLLNAHLDLLIETQLEDGSWPLAWSWEARDPEAWARSEKAWKGIEIVRYLTLFKNYARIQA